MHYVIGDLHANIRLLTDLLILISPQKRDTLIFLGDYIDKNPYPAQTLELLEHISGKFKCIFIKGNHDYLWQKYILEKDYSRRDYLRQKGGLLTLAGFRDDGEKLLIENDVHTIGKYLGDYFRFLEKCRDYFMFPGYIALHAGIKAAQIHESPLKFAENNYFLRPAYINKQNLYLDKYRLVAGHTFLHTHPLISRAYVNIDLGAGYGKYLGALIAEKNQIIRSDGKIYPVQTP